MLATDRSFARLVDYGGGTVSPEIFSSPELYEQELEQIFARCWLFVGHESQIPNPGDFIRSRMGEEQVIVTRDRQHQIHVLLNSCPHRGNMVCRYDQGNALGFQCSFHGWVFNSAGELVTLPQSGDGYDHMRKEEWGLMRAKVEVFQGSIWATWDHSAPSFLEYLGGCDAYLKTSFVDADGSDNGAEILGSPMKWRIGMNWKVPMPDYDIPHAWTTHRSLAVGLGVGPSGAPIERGPDGGYVGRLGRRNTMQVSFPEGHTTAVEVPSDHANGAWPDSGEYDDWPIIRQYLRDKYEARKMRLGVLASQEEGPHVFPNLGFFGRVIRVLHPEGPASTEMWSYFLVDKAAPQAVKDAMARYYEHWYGPGGMTQKDDMENWYVLTRWTKGHMTRKLRLNAQLGLGKPPLDGPSTFGLPGLWAPSYSDENTRRFYQRWAEVMQARAWDDLRVKDTVR